MCEVRNLAIYMADGVRWDHHPEAIRERGVTFRTIASSLHTPTAIASMLTGLYLSRHGVRGFTDALDESTPTVLDWFPHAGVSDTPGNFNKVIYGTLLRRYDPIPLADIEEPFGWFMRDAGGHAPYNGFDETLQTGESVRSYLRAHGGDDERIRRDYRDAMKSSIDRFERFVLDPLRERGILDETLVVFLSDHGQLLGEYGHVGESYPACPELVYVPTTLIHPSIDATPGPDLLRHVDLRPSVASLLTADASVEPSDGTDVFGEGTYPDYGACFYDRPYPWPTGEFRYTIESLWDDSGGHVFVRSGRWDKIRLAIGFLTRIPAGIHYRRSRSMDGLRMLFENQRTWDSPSFSVAEADAILESLSTGDIDSDLTLTSDTEENLHELGYL